MKSGGLLFALLLCTSIFAISFSNAQVFSNNTTTTIEFFNTTTTIEFFNTTTTIEPPPFDIQAWYAAVLFSMAAFLIALVLFFFIRAIKYSACCQQNCAWMCCDEHGKDEGYMITVEDDNETGYCEIDVEGGRLGRNSGLTKNNRSARSKRLRRENSGEGDGRKNSFKRSSDTHNNKGNVQSESVAVSPYSNTANNDSVGENNSDSQSMRTRQGPTLGDGGAKNDETRSMPNSNSFPASGHLTDEDREKQEQQQQQQQFVPPVEVALVTKSKSTEQTPLKAKEDTEEI